MKVVVVKPNEKPEVREIKDANLENLQACVNGMIERVMWKNGYTMYANEEGLILGMDLNTKVSRHPEIRKHGYDGIVGPVVVFKDRKGKGMTDEEVEFVVKEFS